MSNAIDAATGIVDFHDRESISTLSRSEKLCRINPLKFEGWNELIRTAPGHTFFHTSNWARVLCETYGYEPHYYVQIREGKLTVLIPLIQVSSRITGRRAVCLPFSDYCEPIVAEAIAFSELVGQILPEAQNKGWEYIEFRGGDALQELKPYSCCYQHILSLDGGEEQIYSNLRRNNRDNLKKSHKNNLQVHLSDTPEAVREFYRLQCLTRKKHGLPPQPFRFFKKIHEHIIANKMGSVLLATHKEVSIAGAIFFYFGNRVIHKYAASDESLLHLHGNSCLTWEIICWACQNGYRELCFGRAAMDNPGLIQYKDGWRAEKKQLNYYRYDLKTASFLTNQKTSNESGYGIFRKMPMPILKMAGNLLYRHIG